MTSLFTKGLISSCYVATLGVVIATITSALSHLHLLFELSSHFKIQYMLLSALLAIILLLSRRYKTALLALLLFSVHAFYVIPYYVPSQKTITSEKPSTLKILHANVLISNHQHDPFIELINNKAPDMIIVQEFSHQWHESLKVIHAQYPHRLLHPEANAFGIGIYSRYPFDNAALQHWGTAKLPSIHVRTTIDNKQINLIATHPFPPISNRTYQARNNQLDAIAAVVNNQQHPTIVVGDLNTTMWSHTYRHFEQQSGLLNARKGFGMLPSWPAGLLPMSIPIDHILASESFFVNDLQIMPTIGSDHLPLFAELRF